MDTNSNHQSTPEIGIEMQRTSNASFAHTASLYEVDPSKVSGEEEKISKLNLVTRYF